jgi:hypothetical protein
LVESTQLRVRSAAPDWPIVGDNICGSGPRFGEPTLHLTVIPGRPKGEP